jgi:hypothetical protein
MEGNGKEKEKEKKATKVAATVVACPPDVEKQVWEDWLSLRKSKGAKVTQTVLDGAISESVKAGMSLENFLRSPNKMKYLNGKKVTTKKAQMRNTKNVLVVDLSYHVISFSVFSMKFEKMSR